jgi:hypothetical protein
LERMATVTRQHGAVPVFVALDNVVEPSASEVRALRDADAAGFLVFNLFDLWQNREKSALRVAEWDNHPNAAGHQLIADRLFELMRQHRSELRLGTTVPQLASEQAVSSKQSASRPAAQRQDHQGERREFNRKERRERREIWQVNPQHSTLVPRHSL